MALDIERLTGRQLIAILEENGWIIGKIMRWDGVPICNLSSVRTVSGGRIPNRQKIVCIAIPQTDDILAQTDLQYKLNLIQTTRSQLLAMIRRFNAKHF